MTQEALKLAIQLRDTASGYWTENEIPIIEKLIQLLAQPEQEPVACIYKGYLYMAHEFQSGQVPVDSQPLYTTPPQRTWVGLTDQDWKEIEDMPDTFDQGVAWAQAKLKQKNGYTEENT